MMAMLGLYVGTEVTIGGWIVSCPPATDKTTIADSYVQVTYILEYRGGGVSSGYIATGFWGGQSSN